jgi:hypothetical protein
MTTSSPTVENFCTLFDKNYLPLGMALHQSLLIHAQPFHLWILCMDEQVEQQLQQLNLTCVTLIPLKEIETPELLSAKAERSRGEYCWTLTPFTFEAVFDRDKTVLQVTYLDADLFFFDNPKILLDELPKDKNVLITDHAYAPEYDQSSISGRFCVQFLTFKRSKKAFEVMHWWQERCLEWCFNRVEDGKFGDQKYLDLWLKLFGESVYIIRQTNKTLAPWNINFFSKKNKIDPKPVFYHFHTLKIISPNRIQLYFKYRIGKRGLKLYKIYADTVVTNLKKMKSMGMLIPFLPQPKQNFMMLRSFRWMFLREIGFKSYSLEKQ